MSSQPTDSTDHQLHEQQQSGDQVDSHWFHNKKKTTFKAEDADDYYAMKRQKDAEGGKRGRCVILNYEDFDTDHGHEAREGTLHDVQALNDTFSELGFRVVIYNDLTVRRTREVLDSESQLNHDSFDCLALCILTHGDNGIIFCKDDYISTDDVLAPFTADRCPSLVGKPKLFFIQACQGGELDHGTLVVNDATDSSKLSYPQCYFRIPNTADFLIFYSTYPGYFSWRTPTTGSWFIQELCTVLRDCASQTHRHHMDLLSMLVRVSRKVAFERESHDPEDELRHKKKQMPCFVSTLTRLVRF